MCFVRCLCLFCYKTPTVVQEAAQPVCLLLILRKRRDEARESDLTAHASRALTVSILVVYNRA